MTNYLCEIKDISLGTYSLRIEYFILLEQPEVWAGLLADTKEELRKYKDSLRCQRL